MTTSQVSKKMKKKYDYIWLTTLSCHYTSKIASLASKFRKNLKACGNIIACYIYNHK